jgi:hypothetical protein
MQTECLNRYMHYWLTPLTPALSRRERGKSRIARPVSLSLRERAGVRGYSNSDVKL